MYYRYTVLPLIYDVTKYDMHVQYMHYYTMTLSYNYTFYNTTETSLKSGNATTGTHNNNTYGSWVGIYNQSNVLQLSPSITLTSSSRAVKIETNIHARVDRVRLGFRIIRVVSGQSDVVVVGSEQWGRTVPEVLLMMTILHIV